MEEARQEHKYELSMRYRQHCLLIGMNSNIQQVIYNEIQMHNQFDFTAINYLDASKRITY